MSKAVDLIKKVNELSYLGMHNDYSSMAYDQDAAEYMKPFADLQLPDKPKEPDTQQTRMMMRKSRGEDGIANPVQ
jgi:hypothetical protein